MKRKNLALMICAVTFATVFAVAMPTDVKATPNSLLFTYTGDVLPSADGWTIKNYPAYESIGAHVEDGVLHFTDYYTYWGSAILYQREWEVIPSAVNVAEFDIKAVSCSSYVGIYFGTSDGEYNMLYTVYPDRIASSAGYYLMRDNPEYTYYFNTTAQFNTYKAVIQDGIAKLYINEVMVLEQPANPGIYNVKGVEFGAGSSDAIGEAYFDGIRVYRIPSYVQATVDIDPDALNLKSKGKFITFYIEPLDGYNVEDIDIDSVALTRIDDDLLDPPLYIVGPSEIGDYDDDGITDLMVKFDKQELISLLEVGDEELTVSGELMDGRQFEGSYTIKVIEKGKKCCIK